MFKKLFKKDNTGIVAFASGKVLPLEAVNDEMFSKKLLGDGFAIDSIDGYVYAPMSGTLTSVFPTGHAYGLVNKELGYEILLHLGIDTVETDGEGFDIKVEQGDVVKRGDLLAIMDLDFFRKKKIDATIMLVFPQGEQVEILKDEVIALEEDVVNINNPQ